jgi:hypothetical protein
VEPVDAENPEKVSRLVPFLDEDGEIDPDWSRGEGRAPGSGLTTQQAAFVREYVGNGFNAGAAAKAAGYADNGISAWRLMRNSAVQAEVRRWMETTLRTEAAPKALGFLVRALDDQRLSGAARVRAAENLLEMSGYKGSGARPALQMPTDKPMAQWTLEELDAFVHAGQKSLQQLEQTRARTIDGVGGVALNDARNGDATD